MADQQTNNTKVAPTKKAGYEIGQIVYILSAKGQSIIPAMIVEQAIVQTLSGKNVSWKLAMGAAEKQKVVDSSNINGEIYSTLDDVRAVLQVRLSKFIDDITSQAKKRTNLWYGSQLKAAGKKTESSGKIPANGMIDPEDFLDDIEGPAVTEAAEAHVLSPEEDQSNLSSAAQKQRLKSMVSMSDEEASANGLPVGETPAATRTPGAFIEGPDGTKIPVNLDL